MSCVAIGLTEKAAIVACDGAVYSSDTGNVMGLMSKVIVIPRFSAALSWTGIGPMGVVVYEQLFMMLFPDTFDEAVSLLAGAAQDSWHKIVSSGGYPWDSQSQVTLTGFSESRQRFEAWTVVSYRKELVDDTGKIVGVREPWVAQEINQAMWASFAPPADSDIPKRFGLEWSDGDNSLVDMAARMICAARACSGSLEGEEQGTDSRPYAVGGFIEMTLLTPGSVRSWICHRWPDQIGEPLDPLAGDPMPSFPIQIP